MKQSPERLSPADQDRLMKEDPWFYSHYVYAANMVVSRLARHALLEDSRIFDFGCGDGIMALGVSHASSCQVTALDVTQAFSLLADKARAALRIDRLPDTLRFVQVDPEKPLPFPGDHFDAGYSWSVFEHVSNVDAALSEVRRILKPGGTFFLQIEPLYASPFGSHLKRLVDEPWAHLLMEPVTYLDRALTARDAVPDEEKDILYRENEFEGVKRYLVGEYKTLNRITVRELVSRVLDAGLHIREMQTTQVGDYAIPPALLRDHSEYDLRTNEIQLVITK